MIKVNICKLITCFCYRSYYIGTPKNNPGHHQLYRVSSVPPKYGEPLISPQCLTCTKDEYERKLTTTVSPARLVTSWDDDWEEDATVPPTTTPAPKRRRSQKDLYHRTFPVPCQYHDAVFAPGDLGFALISCLGPDVPSSAIFHMPPKGDFLHPIKPIYYIQNNTRLRNRIRMVALPQVKSFPVMISGGYHAQVRLFLPPGLREDEITRYPLILHV